MKTFNTKTEIENFIQNEELGKTFIFEDEEMTHKVTAVDTLIFVNEDKDLQIIVNKAKKTVQISEL
jgi:hypothetical protein